MKTLLGIVLTIAVSGLGYGVAKYQHSLRDVPKKASTEGTHLGSLGAGSRSIVRNEPASLPALSQSAASSELARLRRDVAYLRAEMRALRDQRADEDDSRARPDPSDPELEARLREEHREYLTDLAENFPNESVDRSWSSTTYDAIVDALESSGLKGSTDGVECRSQTCRVEVATPTREDFYSMSMFVLEVAQALPKVDYDHVDDGEGNRRTIMYMSRFDDPPEEMGDPIQ